MANCRWNDHCSFIDCSSDRRCPHSKQWCCKSCRNSNSTFCMAIKLRLVFNRINKVDRDYSYWQILSLVCPLEFQVTLLLCHRSYSGWEDGSIVYKVYLPSVTATLFRIVTTLFQHFNAVLRYKSSWESSRVKVDFHWRVFGYAR